MEQTEVAKKFRLNSKKLFLTYPKNDTTKQTIAENLQLYFGKNLEGYSVGQEYHQDGTLHLHVCVFLKEKVDIKGANTLDVIAGRHGNYQSLKKPKNCIEYTMKDDKEVLLWGTAKKIVESGEGRFTSVAKMILSGKRLRDIRDEEPGFYLQNAKKIKEMEEEVQEELMIKEIKSKTDDVVLRDWQKKVMDRIDKQNDRQILWVVDGVGNSGKSFLADYLEGKGAFRTDAGKVENIMYSYQREKLVVFDFEREQQKLVQYGLLEKFKNGKIVSSKYTPCKKYVIGCKVVVFANWDPKYDALSKDRWDVFVVTPGVDNTEKNDYSQYNFSV